MTTRAARSNTAAVRRAVGRLRKQDRNDELGEVVVASLATSAALLDAVCGPESDVAAYGRAAVLRAHAMQVDQLVRLVGPSGSDSFDAFMAELSQPSGGSSYNAARDEPNYGTPGYGTPGRLD